MVFVDHRRTNLQVLEALDGRLGVTGFAVFATPTLHRAIPEELILGDNGDTLPLQGHAILQGRRDNETALVIALYKFGPAVDGMYLNRVVAKHFMQELTPSCRFSAEQYFFKLRFRYECAQCLRWLVSARLQG